MHEGFIARIRTDKRFGFIGSPDFFDDVYFHAECLNDSLTFDEQLTGRRVLFDSEPGKKGPRAINVRAAV